jgi:hypothetical protein
MPEVFGIKLGFLLTVATAGCFYAGAQAPGVPICSQMRQESQYRARLQGIAKELLAGSDALKPAQARRQLKRSTCQLELPETGTTKLPAREVCMAARQSHVRIGWSYICTKCGKWHLNLAGGYAVTARGAVATCFHVVEPAREVREGCLVAVVEDEAALPVLEVLAANRESDACIVRIAADRVKPLPLNSRVYPGDTAYCYSDPAEHRDYFSAGIVNRFYQLSGSRPANARSNGGTVPTRINVSTDWAPGSSGSAVLDDCGNAIGHVTSISAVPDEQAGRPADTHAAKPAAIVFHEAVSARDVLRLVRSRTD